MSKDLSDEELGIAIQAIMHAWSFRTHPAMQASAAAADLGRRVRELFPVAPTLPPEPASGFARARFPIAVGADGQWCVSAASHDQESESIEATDWFRREGYPSRVSFITADVPLPSSPAEIVGAVVTT